jgi:anti-sigma factor RsiW
MSAHLSNEIVERFHRQSLAEADRSTIYEHILSCETCRQRVVTSQAEVVALQSITDHLLPQAGDEPYHLDAATIGAFVEDTLDPLDRSTAKLHLEDCDECSTEVTDLRESLATMKAASPQREPSDRIK